LHIFEIDVFVGWRVSHYLIGKKLYLNVNLKGLSPFGTPNVKKGVSPFGTPNMKKGVSPFGTTNIKRGKAKIILYVK